MSLSICAKGETENIKQLLVDKRWLVELFLVRLFPRLPYQLIEFLSYFHCFLFVLRHNCVRQKVKIQLNKSALLYQFFSFLEINKRQQIKQALSTTVLYYSHSFTEVKLLKCKF